MPSCAMRCAAALCKNLLQRWFLHAVGHANYCSGRMQSDFQFLARIVARVPGPRSAHLLIVQFARIDSRATLCLDLCKNAY